MIAGPALDAPSARCHVLYRGEARRLRLGKNSKALCSRNWGQEVAVVVWAGGRGETERKGETQRERERQRENCTSGFVQQARDS